MASKKKPRITYATATVLYAIKRGHCYGFDIMDISGLPDGTVYPILRRLQAAGLLESQWEEATDARTANRPARKLYRLTHSGDQALAEAVARFRGLSSSIPTSEAL